MRLVVFPEIAGKANGTLLGRQRVCELTDSGTGLQNNSYLFDDVGNLTQRQDNNAGTTESVYYDALNRLSHTVGDTSTQLTYDAMGRLATWEAYGNSTNTKDYTTQQPGCTYYANAQPHAVRKNTQGSWPPSSFCYDANGNLLTESASGTVDRSTTWMSFNQPNKITAPTLNSASQFLYDQNHERYEQIASYSGSPENTEYIGGLMEKMTNSSGTAYRYYVPAGNNFIVYNRWTSGTNALNYVTKDHLGSTAVITDHAGALVVAEKFSALGWNENTSAQAATMATITRHEFTGHEGLNNSGLGLVNMDGRVYNPSGSMFLSADPNIPDPTDTRDYDRYAYVKYDPLTLVDPTGFYDCGDDPLAPCQLPAIPITAPLPGCFGDCYVTFPDTNPAPGIPGVPTPPQAPPLQRVVVQRSRLRDPVTLQPDVQFVQFTPAFGPSIGMPMISASAFPPQQQSTQTFHNKVCGAAASLGDAGSAPNTNSGAISMAGGALSNAAKIAEDLAPSAARVAESVAPVAGYAATFTSGVSAYQDFSNHDYAGGIFEGVDTAVEGILSAWGPLGASAAGLYQLAGGSKFITEQGLTGLCAISGGS